MQEMIELFREKDLFAKLVGIELLDIKPGYAKAKLEIREHHLNALNVAHGAAIFTLGDLVFAAASNSHGPMAMAVNVSISFLKAAGAGATLVAEARERSLNPKLASYQIDITDDEGDIVAVFQGMVYRKKEPLLVVSNRAGR